MRISVRACVSAVSFIAERSSAGKAFTSTDLSGETALTSSAIDSYERQNTRIRIYRSI